MTKSLSNRSLHYEIARLRAENGVLRNEVRFLRTHPKIARGLRGEELVARLVDGLPSTRGAPHDLVTERAGVRLEIKCSSLLAIRGKVTKRWVWTKMHGEAGNKKFDRLILVGDVDPRFSHLYRDPQCPYIFFDVPFREVPSLTYGIRPGRASIIHVTTNPEVVKSPRASRLFLDFQTTVRELERRYALRSTWRKQSNPSLHEQTGRQRPAAELQH